MNAVITQQVGVCLNRASSVDFYDLHIVTAHLVDGRQGAPSDTSKPVNAYFNCHDSILWLVARLTMGLGGLGAGAKTKGVLHQHVSDKGGSVVSVRANGLR